MANKNSCDRFIEEFGPLIIERYRSKLLDRTFGEMVTYYIGPDEMSAEIRLHAIVRVDTAEEFVVVGAPSFYLAVDEDDLIQQVVNSLGLEEEEARQRLEKAGLLKESPMSTQRYEVRARYQGVSTYFVEAPDDEDAAEQARGRYRNGEPDDATGSEHEEIVGTDVRPIAAGVPQEVMHMNDAESAFKILTDKLLDAAYRFTPEGGSDTLRAYCAVLLDLDWRGERAASIRDTLHKVAFYAASGAIEETRIGARHLGNMVNGRAWHDGNGRAG